MLSRTRNDNVLFALFFNTDIITDRVQIAAENKR